MKPKKGMALRITLLIALAYWVLGNIVGYFVLQLVLPGDSILSYLFIPYTYDLVLFYLAGFNYLLIGQVIAFGLSIIVFFPIGLYFQRRNNNKHDEIS